MAAEMDNERAVTFEADGLRLEGILHAAEANGSSSFPSVAICHPHPLLGGDMDNNVVMALFEKLADHGFVALRFNFRGVGNSEGEHGGGRDERVDVVAALDFLAAQPTVDAERLFLAGYSFGAAVALSTPYPGLVALAAVSPPLTSVESLANLCPTLLVFGESDKLAPASGLARADFALPADSRTAIISGADHFWWGHEEEASSEVVAFFKECAG